MGTMRERQREVQLYRGQVPSPGRPTVAWRADRVRFWAAVAAGLKTEDAAREAGVSAPVAFRWFRHAGGVNPSLHPTVSGRYLSFGEREEIALLRAQGHGVREIAWRLGRSPSTISRELRRNASTRTWRLDYKASIAQWHAERRARRPKVAKLATTSGSVRMSRNDCQVECAVSTVKLLGRPGRNGTARTSRVAVIAAGCRDGAQNKSRAGCRSTSPMIRRCGSATKRSTRRSTCRAAGR